MNLDDLVSRGLVRPHVAENIRAKTASVLKQAGPSGVPGEGTSIPSHDWKKGIGLAAAMTAASFGVPMIVGAAGRGAGALGSAAMKPIRFKRMLKEHPDLAEIDQKSLKAGFNTLHNFAPSLASDPNVAASFVKQQGQYGLLGADVARQLIGTQKQLSDIKRTGSFVAPAVPQIGDALLRGAETGESLREQAYHQARGRQQGMQAGMDLDALREQTAVVEEEEARARMRFAQQAATAQEKGQIHARAEMKSVLEELARMQGKGTRTGQIVADYGLKGRLGAIEGAKERGKGLGGPAGP